MLLDVARRWLGVSAPSTRLLPAKHVISTTHGARTVLLDSKADLYYTLDEVASRIWALAADGLTSDEIAYMLVEEYETDIDTAFADVATFCRQMQSRKLMVAA